MATVIDQYLTPTEIRSIRSSKVLSKVIEKKKPLSEIYNVEFAPLKNYNDTRVELVVKSSFGAGLAQFKADNANTPIVTQTGQLQRQVIDLVTIAEKDVLNSSDLKALESIDPAFAARAAATLVEKALMLRVRNTNRTRWLAWKAAQDAVVITYPNGTTITVDWDLNGDGMNSDFGATHLPTVATSWADAAADIIGDVNTYAKRIADDLGCDVSEMCLHVSSTVWAYMKKNTALKGNISSASPRITTLRRTEVSEILEIQDIKVNNEAYWDGQTKYRFLDENYALLTCFQNGKYQYNGMPLMEMYDGLVVRVVDGKVVVENNPGLVAETYVDPDVSAESIRVQSGRMPIVNHPAGFLYAKVIL